MKKLLKLSSDRIFIIALIILALIPLILLPVLGSFSLYISLSMISGYSKGIFIFCVCSFLYMALGRFLFKRLTLNETKPENLSIKTIHSHGDGSGLNRNWYRLLNFYLAIPSLGLFNSVARQIFYVAAMFSILFLSLLILGISAPYFGPRQDIDNLIILIPIIIYTQLVINGIITLPNAMFNDVQIAINHNQAMLDDQAEQEEFARRNEEARIARAKKKEGN